MKVWKRQAQILKKARLEARMSQEDLAWEMKLKNAQFISNIEREKCGIPLKKIVDLASVLKISTTMLVEAIMEDYREEMMKTVLESASAYPVVEQGLASSVPSAVNVTEQEGK